ncbi:unnamed protein product [Schistosoma mattheei]|uniref:Uncharacterized protein n=1 Tax=Schistosoma mattheei TaxID=31246 RepID=A0A183P548_9TREM|nr:unnamed protein product [Schistosoma mattheei]
MCTPDEEYIILRQIKNLPNLKLLADNLLKTIQLDLIQEINITNMNIIQDNDLYKLPMSSVSFLSNNNNTSSFQLLPHEITSNKISSNSRIFNSYFLSNQSLINHSNDSTFIQCLNDTFDNLINNNNNGHDKFSSVVSSIPSENARSVSQIPDGDNDHDDQINFPQHNQFKRQEILNVKNEVFSVNPELLLNWINEFPLNMLSYQNQTERLINQIKNLKDIIPTHWTDGLSKEGN